MQKQTSLLLGAISGGLAVAIGAFGAHALKPLLMETGREATFELAVRYQFYHALALLATGLLTSETRGKALHYSSLCFVLGIILFSGSLYVLCFTGIKMLGAITPFGGVFFILGWVLLGIGVYKK
ncbi:MAG TPA: DUF423 domain-containing protein [Chryseolinea sp.]|nr:DUF423 domain-containing protein [Chryseolinea sp.]